MLCAQLYTHTFCSDQCRTIIDYHREFVKDPGEPAPQPAPKRSRKRPPSAKSPRTPVSVKAPLTPLSQEQMVRCCYQAMYDDETLYLGTSTQYAVDTDRRSTTRCNGAVACVCVDATAKWRTANSDRRAFLRQSTRADGAHDARGCIESATTTAATATGSSGE